MLARLIFAWVNFAARKGLVTAGDENPTESTPKERARRTGLRGETYAYWYLRRHGYTIVAHNYTAPGVKGEIDMIGFDRRVIAFVEVKTRDASRPDSPDPEFAVNPEKRRHLARVARQFLRSRRVESSTSWRFDIVAIEAHPGRSPEIRLHKGAFIPE